MTTKINCSTLKVRKWLCKREKREGKGVSSFFFPGVWIDRKVSNHTSPFPYTLSLILTAFRSCSLIRMLSISGLIFTFNPHTLYTKWKYTASSSPIQSTWNIVSDILSFKTCYNCPEISRRTCTSNSSENRVRKHRHKNVFSIFIHRRNIESQASVHKALLLLERLFSIRSIARSDFQRPTISSQKAPGNR